MSKYEYKIFEVSVRVFNTFKFEKEYGGGILAEGISGINDELLFVVAYEIVEDEDDKR